MSRAGTVRGSLIMTHAADKPTVGCLPRRFLNDILDRERHEVVLEMCSLNHSSEVDACSRPHGR